MRAEILEYVILLRRSEIDVVDQSHSLYGNFPTFRSRSFPGNPSHVSAIVAGMAASTFRFHEGIRDRNTGLSTRLSLSGNSADPPEHTIEQHKGGKQPKYDGSPTHTFPVES